MRFSGPAGARRLWRPAAALAVTVLLLAGIALGPSVFGLLAPHAHAAPFPHDPAQKAMAGAVSLTGIAVPFVCGLAVGLTVLGQTRRGGHDLIVLGVQPRPSGASPFGALADSLVEGAEHSLLLVLGDDPVKISPDDPRRRRRGRVTAGEAALPA